MNPFTYEVGIDEPLHPDHTINARMTEFQVSDCLGGCKLYKDPNSSLVVLGHMASYGCRTTREMLLNA